jgi:hypothetical protein
MDVIEDRQPNSWCGNYHCTPWAGLTFRLRYLHGLVFRQTDSLTGERQILIYILERKAAYLNNKGKAAGKLALVQMQLNFVLSRHFVMYLQSEV